MQNKIKALSNQYLEKRKEKAFGCRLGETVLDGLNLTLEFNAATATAVHPVAGFALSVAQYGAMSTPQELMSEEITFFDGFEWANAFQLRFAETQLDYEFQSEVNNEQAILENSELKDKVKRLQEVIPVDLESSSLEEFDSLKAKMLRIIKSEKKEWNSDDFQTAICCWNLANRNSAEKEKLGELQRLVGLAFKDGKALGKDLRQAVTYLKKSYENENVEGAYEYGMMRETGPDDRHIRDHNMAKEAFRFAASHNHTKAQSMLNK